MLLPFLGNGQRETIGGNASSEVAFCFLSAPAETVFSRLLYYSCLKQAETTFSRCLKLHNYFKVWGKLYVEM